MSEDLSDIIKRWYSKIKCMIKNVSYDIREYIDENN